MDKIDRLIERMNKSKKAPRILVDFKHNPKHEAIMEQCGFPISEVDWDLIGMKDGKPMNHYSKLYYEAQAKADAKHKCYIDHVYKTPKIVRRQDSDDILIHGDYGVNQYGIFQEGGYVRDDVEEQLNDWLGSLNLQWEHETSWCLIITRRS